MKTCPECHSQYTDDSLRYCVLDGKQLIFSTHSKIVSGPYSGVETLENIRLLVARVKRARPGKSVYAPTEKAVRELIDAFNPQFTKEEEYFVRLALAQPGVWPEFLAYIDIVSSESEIRELEQLRAVADKKIAEITRQDKDLGLKLRALTTLPWDWWREKPFYQYLASTESTVILGEMKKVLSERSGIGSITALDQMLGIKRSPALVVAIEVLHLLERYEEKFCSTQMLNERRAYIHKYYKDKGRR